MSSPIIGAATQCLLPPGRVIQWTSKIKTMGRKLFTLSYKNPQTLIMVMCQYQVKEENTPRIGIYRTIRLCRWVVASGEVFESYSVSRIWTLQQVLFGFLCACFFLFCLVGRLFVFFFLVVICELCPDQVELSLFRQHRQLEVSLTRASATRSRPELGERFCLPTERIWLEPASLSPKYFILPAATLGAYCIR